MPRGWKPKPTEQERLAAIAADTTKIIKTAMVRCEIKYDMDLAEKIGMNRGTLSAKLKNHAWKQEDLCRIVAALNIPPDEALKMLGVRS